MHAPAVTLAIALGPLPVWAVSAEADLPAALARAQAIIGEAREASIRASSGQGEPRPPDSLAGASEAKKAPGLGVLPARPAVHEEGHKVWEQAELERSGYVLTPRGIEKKDDPSVVLSLTDPAHRAAVEAIVREIAERNHIDDPRLIPAFIKSLIVIQPCHSDRRLPQCRGPESRQVSIAPGSFLVRGEGTIYGSGFVGQGDLLSGDVFLAGTLTLRGEDGLSAPCRSGPMCRSPASPPTGWLPQPYRFSLPISCGASLSQADESKIRGENEKVDHKRLDDSLLGKRRFGPERRGLRRPRG